MTKNYLPKVEKFSSCLRTKEFKSCNGFKHEDIDLTFFVWIIFAHNYNQFQQA